MKTLSPGCLPRFCSYFFKQCRAGPADPGGEEAYMSEPSFRPHSPGPTSRGQTVQTLLGTQSLMEPQEKVLSQGQQTQTESHQTLNSLPLPAWAKLFNFSVLPFPPKVVVKIQLINLKH